MLSLHRIFQTLVDDESFLTVVIEGKDKPEKKKVNGMINRRRSQSNALQPGSEQSYNQLDPFIKRIINRRSSYKKIGIPNSMERDLNNINVSFLMSLNLIIREDLRSAPVEE